jgi:transcriptional regulator of arginine metabolism
MTASVSERLQVIRRLLGAGKSSTQEELRDDLEKEGFDVNQSTISRDLRKIGAIKTIDAKGRTVYRSSEAVNEKNIVGQSVPDLILSIEHNDSMIVISTTPGSASLVARHLDVVRPLGILGTIAGDDTIFVAPAKVKNINQTVEAIRNSFSN